MTRNVSNDPRVPIYRDEVSDNFLRDIRSGIGSDTTDANSAPPAGVPDTAGGALPIGTLICLRRNTDIMGVVMPPGHYTRPGEVCVRWDDRDDLYNIQSSEIEEQP